MEWMFIVLEGISLPLLYDSFSHFSFSVPLFSVLLRSVCCHTQPWHFPLIILMVFLFRSLRRSQKKVYFWLFPFPRPPARSNVFHLDLIRWIGRLPFIRLMKCKHYGSVEFWVRRRVKKKVPSSEASIFIWDSLNMKAARGGLTRLRLRLSWQLRQSHFVNLKSNFHIRCLFGISLLRSSETFASDVSLGIYGIFALSDCDLLPDDVRFIWLLNVL